MAIEEYYITTRFGFGFVRRKSKYAETCFVSSIDISDGVNVRRFETGKPSDVFAVTMYFVLEDGIWKEYFTGIPVKPVDEKSLPEGKILLSRKLPESISEAKKAGVRELIFIYSKDEKKVGAEEFARRISSYNEDEIKKKAELIYEMQEKAEQLGPRLEKEITNIVDEWNAKETAELSNLERKKGAYGKKEGKIGTERREEETGTKIHIPVKVALVAGLLFPFIFVAEDYTVGDALLAVLFLFGCYMLVFSLFVYPDIRYRTARIVCGAGLVLLMICLSPALQEGIGLLLVLLLALLFNLSPFIILGLIFLHFM